MTLNKLLRFCPLLLPLLLSLSAFQSAFALGPQALQLSTRVYLTPGADAIGGFILTGTTGQMTVLIRGMGPSLPGGLADPIIVLNGAGIGSPFTNDNFADPPNNIPAGYQPGTLESAIYINLSAGNYTVNLKGTTSTDSGLALVEVYDITPNNLKLANISTRAFVGTGGNIVIAGFILDPNGSGLERIVVRGLGPSLAAYAVPNVLANPVLELRNANGALLQANDDWQNDPTKAAEIIALGLAPTHNLEAALIMALPPGNYTALLAGLSNTTGNGLVEIYDVGP